MKLDKKGIQEILPHRDPMLLVDTVEELTPGEHIVTTFFVDPQRDIFRGHFPGEPVLPGVYTVECMAQAADVLLMADGQFPGKLPLFIGINNVRFLSKIRPGDTLRIEAAIKEAKTEKAIFTCSAQVFDGDVFAATGDVTLAMR